LAEKELARSYGEVARGRSKEGKERTARVAREQDLNILESQIQGKKRNPLQPPIRSVKGIKIHATGERLKGKKGLTRSGVSIAGRGLKERPG